MQTAWRSGRDSNPSLNVHSTRCRATDGNSSDLSTCRVVLTAGERQVESDARSSVALNGPHKSVRGLASTCGARLPINHDGSINRQGYTRLINPKVSNFENWFSLRDLRIGDFPQCGECSVVYALRKEQAVLQTALSLLAIRSEKLWNKVAQPGTTANVQTDRVLCAL